MNFVSVSCVTTMNDNITNKEICIMIDSSTNNLEQASSNCTVLMSKFKFLIQFHNLKSYSGSI